MHLISCRNVLIYFDRRCRTARSACSRIRLRAKGFSDLARRRVFVSREHATLSPNSRKMSASTRSGAARERTCPGGGRHRRVGGGARGAVGLLPALPADYRLPILIVVHLPPDKTSLLAELFARALRHSSARSGGQGADRARGHLLRPARLSSAGRTGQAAVSV